MAYKGGLEKLRALWAAGKCLQALKLAAGWARLGEHKNRIERGWSAAANPEFYREIGRDPDAMVADGLMAIRERYDLGEVSHEV